MSADRAGDAVTQGDQAQSDAETLMDAAGTLSRYGDGVMAAEVRDIAKRLVATSATDKVQAVETLGQARVDRGASEALGELVWTDFSLAPDRPVSTVAFASTAGMVAGPIWQETDQESECWTAEVQASGRHYVIATVHGSTKQQAKVRQSAILAALAYTPKPAAVQAGEGADMVLETQRDIAGETVCGFRVAAWRETHPEHGEKFGHHYSEHWSTPNTRNPAVKVERLFTEAQLRAALSAPAQPAASDQRAEVERKAICDVAIERERQMGAEGWAPDHDDKHDRDLALPRAAACYALAGTGANGPFWVNHLQVPQQVWPYPWEWKPKDRRSNLVRAAALLIAEIQRVDRAALASTSHDAAEAAFNAVAMASALAQDPSHD